MGDLTLYNYRSVNPRELFGLLWAGLAGCWLAPVRVSFPFATTLVRFLLGGIHFVNLRDVLFFLFSFSTNLKRKMANP